MSESPLPCVCGKPGVHVWVQCDECPAPNAAELEQERALVEDMEELNNGLRTKRDRLAADLEQAQEELQSQWEELVETVRERNQLRERVRELEETYPLSRAKIAAAERKGAEEMRDWVSGLWAKWAAQILTCPPERLAAGLDEIGKKIDALPLPRDQ